MYCEHSLRTLNLCGHVVLPGLFVLLLLTVNLSFIHRPVSVPRGDGVYLWACHKTLKSERKLILTHFTTLKDEMVGWHHQLNGHEFEQTPEVVKDREAWRATVRGVAKSRTQLSN